MPELLSEYATQHLYESLLYLKMSQLKEICINLRIPPHKKKIELIQAICTYVKEGKILDIPKIPEISKALKSTFYPLKPSTKILHGNYKNDLATRKFMKTLVGQHFHYTAYGIDWINEKWMNGTPPTYEEFAIFWQKEYEKRQLKKVSPKKEWAYINFVQEYGKSNPYANRKEIMKAWKKELEKHSLFVQTILQKFILHAFRF